MNENHGFDPSSFGPGEKIKIIDGTFVGKQGVVLSLAQAQDLWKMSGGEAPPVKATPGVVCVAVTIFNRRVPVWLDARQVQRL
jgi:transcription antitermination factor NusG